MNKVNFPFLILGEIAKQKKSESFFSKNQPIFYQKNKKYIKKNKNSIKEKETCIRDEYERLLRIEKLGDWMFSPLFLVKTHLKSTFFFSPSPLLSRHRENVLKMMKIVKISMVKSFCVVRKCVMMCWNFSLCDEIWKLF